mmetsp:Transcript_9865/g.20907  ORF Transcript_9865/g.20907 Transcript_9865/m.20907 type:complete len:87 (+) Transcript_9865:101-361(+)
MADQKNAAWLQYLRSFLKQGEGCNRRGDGRTPKNKRKSGEGLEETSVYYYGGDSGRGGVHGVQAPVAIDSNDTSSTSNKRMRRNGY